jgi:circadian locomoter output cycle kaput protein
MTIYELVYEEEQQDIYNILLNPPKSIDPLQNGINEENQVSFLCHVKRGKMDSTTPASYEYVQFNGYFSEQLQFSYLFSSVYNLSYLFFRR